MIVFVPLVVYLAERESVGCTSIFIEAFFHSPVSTFWPLLVYVLFRESVGWTSAVIIALSKTCPSEGVNVTVPFEDIVLVRVSSGLEVSTSTVISASFHSPVIVFVPFVIILYVSFSTGCTSVITTALSNTYPAAGLNILVPLEVILCSNVSSGFSSAMSIVISASFHSPVSCFTPLELYVFVNLFAGWTSTFTVASVITLPGVGVIVFVPLVVYVLLTVSSGFFSDGTLTFTIAFSSPVFSGSASTVYCPLALTVIDFICKSISGCTSTYIVALSQGTPWALNL